MDGCLSLFDLCNGEKDAQKVAVIFDDGQTKQSLTYRELSVLADQLSTVLGEYMYPHESSVVGICMEIQLVTPALLIGIMKRGAAFYNFDSDAIQLVNYVITHVGCQVLLTDNRNLKHLKGLIRELEGEVKPLCLSSTTNLHLVYLRAVRRKDLPAKLAYCITTSGTTGRPKIVNVPHSCVVPNIIHLREIYHMTSDDLVVVCSPLTFDPSIVEVFTTLSVGGRLLIVPSVVKLMPDVLLDILYHRNKVTVMQATPTLLSRFGPTKLQNSLLGDEECLRVLSLGGEKFPDISYLKACKSKHNHTKFINLYGITEVSVWATVYQVTQEDFRLNGDIPLGEGLSETTIEVKDDQGLTVREGHGELFIGGFNRQCLVMTSEQDWDTYDENILKFRPTGDIVRLDPNGRMFYVGRKDHQIKRNGKRIDLEEIKQVTLTYDGIQDSVTLMADSKLVTFVTRVSEKSVSINSLRDKIKNHLMQCLPSHSIPDDILVIDFMPMTKHGKVDLKQLETMYVISRKQKGDNVTYSTAFLRNQWMEKICVMDTSIKSDSNFIKLGGSSLTAVHLLNDLELYLKCQLPYLLDRLINETFKDCDEYLHQTINNDLSQQIINKNTLGSETVKVEQIIKDDFLNTTCTTNENNKRENENNIKIKKSVKRSRFKQTISKGNQYVTCKPVLNETNDADIHDNSGHSMIEDMVDTLHRKNADKHRKIITHLNDFEISNEINSKNDEPRDDIVTKSHKSSEYDIAVSETKRYDNEVSDLRGFDNYKDLNYEDHGQTDMENLVKVHKTDTCINNMLEVSMLKLNLEEGWKFNTGKCVDASPLIALNSEDRGVVFIGSHSHKFFAIAMDIGNLIWEVTLGGRIEGTASLSLCGNFVIVGSYDGFIYSLDSETGSIWWKFQTGSQVKCGPIVDTCTGLVYVGSHDQSVYCLDTLKKTVVWRSTLGSGSIFSSPAVDYAHDRLFVASLGGKLFCLEKDTGQQVWKRDCKKPVFSSLTCTDTGVLVGCTDTCLYHYDLNGNQMWSFCTEAPIFSSPSLITVSLSKTDHSNNFQHIVFGSHDRYLYCLSASGALCWKTKVTSQIYSTPFHGLIRIYKDTASFVPKSDIDILMSKTDNSFKTNRITVPNSKCDFHNTAIGYSFINTRFSNRATNSNCQSMDVLHLPENGECSLSDNTIIPVIVFCCTVGRLYIVDARDGRILCEKVVPGEVFSSPVLYGDSVFVGCRDNHVYTFKLTV